MGRSLVLVCLCLGLAATLASSSVAGAQSPAPAPLDFEVSNGHFFTQTNGSPLGSAPGGYSITNDGGIPFWDEYQRLGGPHVLGYPVTSRFIYDGFITQAMQKAVFQWRPEVKQVWFLNTFDALHEKGRDDWLLVHRQTPRPFDTSPDNGLPWEQVADRHLAMLDQNEAIKAVYFADPLPIDHFGLPVAFSDQGNSFVVRAQRATFQYWKEDVPWAKRGEVSVANGGDLAKEAGLWPPEAVALRLPDGQLVEIPASAPPSVASLVAPIPSPQPAVAQSFAPRPGVYRANSPEYGLHTFVFSHPDTAFRDFKQVTDLGFGWHKALLEWKWIEPDRKGQFSWHATDGLVYGSAGQGLRLIVRVDFPPNWAKSSPSPESPPDFVEDYADFIYALVSRYNSKNPQGRIHAVEVWNEPNLASFWGGKKPDAAAYVRLLRAAYGAAKRADPSVVVISAGLGPTGTNNDVAIPDDIFLQQMYDAGARDYFDVLGAHGPGYKAPPETSPDEAAANPAFGGHRSFTFRRVEDLRDIMVRNGDGGKQVWLTEFGWTSDPINQAYAWHRVSEEEKAEYILRAFKWARENWTPWMGVMSIWNLPAPDWPQQREEYWWSIVNLDGSPRPAYTRLLQARRSGLLP